MVEFRKSKMPQKKAMKGKKGCKGKGAFDEATFERELAMAIEMSKVSAGLVDFGAEALSRA